MAASLLVNLKQKSWNLIHGKRKKKNSPNGRLLKSAKLSNIKGPQRRCCIGSESTSPSPTLAAQPLAHGAGGNFVIKYRNSGPFGLKAKAGLPGLGIEKFSKETMKWPLLCAHRAGSQNARCVCVWWSERRSGSGLEALALDPRFSRSSHQKQATASAGRGTVSIEKCHLRRPG